jgi:hypothetical protein
MGIAKLLAKAAVRAGEGDGVRIGGKGLTKSGADNANRMTPSLKADVVKSTKADVAKIKKGLNAAVVDGDSNRHRLAQQLAGGRAVTRMTGRGAAVAGAGLGAYEVQSRANERSKNENAKKEALADRRKSPDPVKKIEDTLWKPSYAKSEDKPEKKVEKKDDKKKTVKKPESSVREGQNKNIDDDTRKRALDSIKNLNKGGMVKKCK